MITLYKIENLRPEDNILIDLIEDFLTLMPSETLSLDDFGYVKNDLNISVVIPVDSATFSTDQNP